MLKQLGSSTDQVFEAPQLYFSDVKAEAVASLITAAADLALVLDSRGVIRDIALGGSSTRDLDELRQWVGQRWLDTVTVESRIKVTEMLAAAGAEETPDAATSMPASTRDHRQVNHPLAGGLDLPVSYRVVGLGDQGRMLALGRDLRAVAAVQQRLVDAQQSMERDYLRLRHTEARYRLLFEAVGEAVLVLDALSLAIVEHNTSAAKLLGEGGRRLMGRPLVEMLAPASQARAHALLAQVRSLGRGDELEVQLGREGNPLRLAASLFKQDSAQFLLVRLVQPESAGGAAGRPREDMHTLSQVVEAMPDAFVLTDMQGRVLSANRAFCDMVQIASGESAVGQSLDRWLGRSSVDLNVLIGNLRQHGVLKLFPTTLRGAIGEPNAVEISAVAVPGGAIPCLGFTIRDVARRLPAEVRGPRQLPRSADQLTGLVGRLPLKDIVGETTDLIERLCIEAALQLTRDNRASAAEMLGLSRQSLYVKLRRFGIQDASAPPPNDG